MINHCHLLTRTGDGRQHPAPPPRPSREALKDRTTVLLIASQTPVEGALRRGTVVRIVLNLGRHAGQGAFLPCVLPIIIPYFCAGVGEANVLETGDALVLIH